MKLLFIGTSHGVPESNRRCSSCILEAGGCFYLFDMGTQVVEDLRRRNIDLNAVRLAICTHPHGDHTDGLISLVDLVNWYFKSADPLMADCQASATLFVEKYFGRRFPAKTFSRAIVD